VVGPRPIPCLAGTRACLGVGLAFGMTAAIIAFVAGRGMPLAVMIEAGGGVIYSLGWRVHQLSQRPRQDVT
jgi:hypothetical protein